MTPISPKSICRSAFGLQATSQSAPQQEFDPTTRATTVLGKALEHPGYDAATLDREHRRNLAVSSDPTIPTNCYPDDERPAPEIYFETGPFSETGDAHIGRCTGINQHVVLDQYSPISFHHPMPEAKTMMTEVVTSRKLSL